MQKPQDKSEDETMKIRLKDSDERKQSRKLEILVGVQNNSHQTLSYLRRHAFQIVTTWMAVAV